MNAEQTSFNQLTEQFNTKREATVLVERSGEKISTGHYNGQRNENGAYIVNVTGANGEAAYREVSAEALSDAKQAELAEQLAGKSLHDEVAVDTVPGAELFSSEAHDAAEASAEHNEVLTVEAVEELGHDALDASGIDEPKEQDAKSGEFTRFIEAELLYSADIATRTVDELSTAPEQNSQYFLEARRNALVALDTAVRRGLNGESVPVGMELIEATEVLQSASSQLELTLDGDAVNHRGEEIRKSSYNVDDTASEFFKDADVSAEEERSGLVSRARTLQVEISSLLHEDVTHYVDRIGRDERHFSDLLSGVRTALGYIHELNQDNTTGLYRDIQELISLADTSEQARGKLQRELVTISDNIQQLRNVAGALAHL